MADKLEQIQRRAVRIIYGKGTDVDQLVQDGTIETLGQRRERACLNFARKASSSERFGEAWFPRNDNGREVRNGTRRTFIEGRCRTERGRNNPLQFMIRLLNEQALST